jgi:hypothetical protein
VDHGDLVDAALSSAGAWAVGWTAPDTDPAHRTRLLLRLGTIGWEDVSASVPKMHLPRAVALVGADGAIADDAGQVFAIRAGVLQAEPLPPDDPSGAGLGTPDGRPIDALALTAPADGVAVAGGGAAADGFRQVTGGKVADARAAPGRTGMPAVAVVSPTPGQATAIEGPAPCDQPATVRQAPDLWSLGTGGVWQSQKLQNATATTRLCDIALSSGATVIAGERDARAVVWRLEGTSAVRNDDVDQWPPLRGLAAAGDGLWAVGDHGTVLRYAPAPPPPTPDPTPNEDSRQNTAEQTGDPAPVDQSQPAGEETPSVTVTEQRTPAPPTTGSKPAPLPRKPPAAKPPAATPPKPAGRMLTGLKVRRHGHRLVLTFRLSDYARVLIRGRIRNRLVAHATRTLAAGPVRLVIPFSGHRPPTRLAIVVRAADPRVKKSSRRTSR